MSGADGSAWAVATPHELATGAAEDAFDRGGTAVDAALWAAVTLSAVYPHMCGVGGDLFALIHDPATGTQAINASGRAPLGLDVDAIATEGSMPQSGPSTITVPGAVSGWRALLEAGARLPWPDAFRHAIEHAEHGIEMPESIRRGGLARVKADPGLAEVFLAGDRFKDRLQEPALASTLHALSADGPRALYGGAVGERLVEFLAAIGSPMAMRDMRAHRPERTTPLRAGFADLELVVAPPNSQGYVLLTMMRAIEELGATPDPLGPGAADLARVFAVASEDRDAILADPGSMPELDLEERMRAVVHGVQQRSSVAGHRHGDTVAVVTADEQGRCVSLIQSLYSGFGAGYLDPDTGIIPHDRGAGFTLEPGHPNRAAGGKRPAHTLMPVLGFREGAPAWVAGTMGGSAQPQIHAQMLLRREAPPAEIVAAPRWLLGGMEPVNPHDPLVVVEPGIPDSARYALSSAGLRVEESPAADDWVGHAQLIRIDTDGTFTVGSDPRADGAAAAR
ncbi:MAG: gamma-glutamyltransferase [Actinomycetota bacterium]